MHVVQKCTRFWDNDMHQNKDLMLSHSGPPPSFRSISVVTITGTTGCRHGASLPSRRHRWPAVQSSSALPSPFFHWRIPRRAVVRSCLDCCCRVRAPPSPAGPLPGRSIAMGQGFRPVQALRAAHLPRSAWLSPAKPRCLPGCC
ncbi:MAG: hypothetical protein EOQ30_18715 [Mesorhizobium sp.]|nr:hypothetical protein EJ071_14255 [Mesorhizobium sp. M1B.F.Ca.ET.045.04.1.1]RWA66201.1 MAG: hypothetical protein EOQ29_26490 [Mesorhizobium sp.]RWA81786.1 MAG: hypothetical protein EOQ30_18715 [Mesorhizobium sp.]RWB18685.1 MAG: hypothetical protein EOQ40_23690 [Mesorhizobium sp.]